ncbi:MAG: CHASE2 domain-containing protein [Oscillatoriales cyanobacterium C42_A2020_001]|nr:CHASE2 domain-containing protein [Leptolyngbyaceae cyanobacterium C42_A2020_001]
MSQLVVLNLGKGDCQQGFSLVTAQLWLDNSVTPMQLTGSLPAIPTLDALYARWQNLYAALYARRGWRRLPDPNTASSTQLRQSFANNLGDDFELEADEHFIADVSDSAFKSLCHELQQQLNYWLNADSFRPIDRQLRTRLSFNDDVRVIIAATDRRVLRLPWHLWQLFEDYPRAELGLSLADYTRSLKTSTANPSNQVRILVILGNSEGINLETDKQLLAQLPQAQTRFLIEPTLAEIQDQLWQSGWDILCFAGHSSSQGTGTIAINATEQLTLAQLQFALKKAIERGLKLAIFNSCDGLGLAWDLADLQIPQVIVMREPIPDRVAHEFLKYFLVAFSNGQSFYLSVREARERLQALETTFLCATWLPVICQNPAELPSTWEDLRGGSLSHPSPPTPFNPAPGKDKSNLSPVPHSLLRLPPLPILFSSVVATSLVLGMRWLGWFQPMELWGFDRLLMLRPTELPDTRLLIVTLDEADIQVQNDPQRRGSLSDQTLNQVLQILERYQPRAIGLDIYRDFPASSQVPGLKARLQQTKRLVAICKSRDARFDPTGVAPPPELPESQIGFSDFVPDPDGIVRRQLLTQSPDPASPCTTPYAFSTRLAFRYLDQEKITPSFNTAGNLQLGSVELQRLAAHTGGYQTLDARGNQVMIHYRSLSSARAIAPQVSLTQLLRGQVNSNAVKDRLVLIGVTANSGGDQWITPFGASPSDNVSGVLIQAHMISQLISAVLDQRPLIWTWHWLGEALWIWGWAIAGGIVVSWGRSRLYQGLAIVVTLSVLTVSSFVLLTRGGWVP